MDQKVISLINAAAECSIFINPNDPGLSYEELVEVATRLGLKSGEFNDALHHATSSRQGSKRYFPQEQLLNSWVHLIAEEPDYRNFEAFDFVVTELNERVREDGKDYAQLQRDALVERAVSQGFPRRDIQVAVTYQVLANMLTEQDGVLRYPYNNGVRSPLPSAQVRSVGIKIPKLDRARAYPFVKDVIERRADGRAQNAEPLDAFAAQLDALGYGPFRLWWTQAVAELRRVEPSTAPVSTTVLAAALVEGALTFLVRHARQLDLAVFKSKDFDGSPRTWKIENLVSSAASGSGAAVLDLQTKSRVETLIRTRQRIHAGRMLEDHPKGVPDLRPEEARDAKAIAEQAVRCVLDWLQRYPA